MTTEAFCWLLGTCHKFRQSLLRFQPKGAVKLVVWPRITCGMLRSFQSNCCCNCSAAVACPSWAESLRLEEPLPYPVMYPLEYTYPIVCERERTSACTCCIWTPGFAQSLSAWLNVQTAVSSLAPVCPDLCPVSILLNMPLQFFAGVCWIFAQEDNTPPSSIICFQLYLKGGNPYSIKWTF